MKTTKITMISMTLASLILLTQTSVAMATPQQTAFDKNIEATIAANQAEQENLNTSYNTINFNDGTIETASEQVNTLNLSGISTQKIAVSDKAQAIAVATDNFTSTPAAIVAALQAEEDARIAAEAAAAAQAAAEAQAAADAIVAAEAKAAAEAEKAKKAAEAPVFNASPGSSQAMAAAQVSQRGWGSGEFNCLVSLWNKESGWNASAMNKSSGAYGIPQSLPGSKMASAGSDWQTNPDTQIRWGLGYISDRYGTPCGAWAHSGQVGWY